MSDTLSELYRDEEVGNYSDDINGECDSNDEILLEDDDDLNLEDSLTPNNDLEELIELSTLIIF